MTDPATSPVVVSRIQNRRGTQDQFDNLYPYSYSGVGGYGSKINLSSVTATSGDGSTATLSVSSSAYYPPGTTIVVSGVVPSGYNGTYTVLTSSPGTFTYACSATGSLVPGPLQEVYIAYSITLNPNILMPGELALCTDSRRIFLGNTNGEYIELGQQSSGFSLLPLVVELSPQPSPTVIPELTFTATSFTNIMYSLTDNANPDWNSVGNNFSKNGELQITALNPLSLNPVNLVDMGTEINNLLPSSISFTAAYNMSGDIDILYQHDFPVPLKFSTNFIQWAPFSS